MVGVGVRVTARVKAKVKVTLINAPILDTINWTQLFPSPVYNNDMVMIW
jgi:hypothetical protein